MILYYQLDDIMEEECSHIHGISMHIHSMKLEAKDLPPKDKSPPKIPNLSMQLQIITDDTGLESGDPGREIQLSQSSEVPLSKSSRL